jgi:acyl-coenzyme A synthetase/AMP-(fatty) acid ligase
MALSLLGGHPSAVAVIDGESPVTYGELRERVAERRVALGGGRRLVVVTAANALDPIVSYLAALEDGHPVILVAGDGDAALAHRQALIERVDPDVVVGGPDEGWTITERRRGSVHALHPELAMLSSTSGSTGSPKLVRLSLDNVHSNAAAIAEYLRIGPGDRAATTLPLQYCYGLSVVNSHLVAGATLLLTERSVTDETFWTDFRRHGATSFAGVPYTFELLDAGGFEDREVPSLRYITQAGGRLAPERVRRYARLGARRGFEFFVMYGQTEATSRMAYLPPELAETRAGAIGRAIPGGALRVDAAPGEDVGELVYSGPNVMLGYAETPADFARGREIDELRTGDLARRAPDGLVEVVGRLNRFVKVFGLRIDLDRVERLLADDGVEARAACRDERLLVFVRSERAVASARSRTAALLDIPAHAVEGYAVAEFPRTTSGKPDYAALVRFADGAAVRDLPSAAANGAERIRDLYAHLLGRPDATLDDSFAALGGDSLSFVEVAIRLEAIVGRLPRDWPTLPPRELHTARGIPAEDATAGPRTATPEPGRARAGMLASVDTAAVLRAVAIVAIVGTHADLFTVPGGAHLLLAVVGYNLARFQLADLPGASRPRRLLRSAAQLGVPAVLWIGGVALVTGQYAPTTVALVNNFLAGGGWTSQWQFWFLEAAFWSLLLLAAAFAWRRIDLLERARPFAFALGLFGVALGVRLLLVGIEAGPVERYSTPVVFWLIALGWLGARATTLPRRVLVSVLAVVSVGGFLGEPAREAFVVGGILVLLWLPAVPLPRVIGTGVRVLAGASMFVYLTHWQVYPPWESTAPWLGTLLSLAIGIGVWHAHAFATRRAEGWWRGRVSPPTAPPPRGTGRPRPRPSRTARDRARTAPPRERVGGG